MPTNLTPNPSFETGTAPWAVRSNCALDRVQVTGAPDGQWAGRMTAAVTGTMDVQDDATRPAVSPSQQIILSVRLRPVGTTTRLCSVFLEWPGIAGAASSGNVSCPAGSWTTVSVSTTVPAGASSVRPAIRVDSPAAGEQWLVDAIGLYLGSTDPAYQGPFTTANQPPSVSISATATTVDVLDSVTLTAGGSDPDGTALTRTWRMLSGPASGTLPSTTAASVTVTLGLPGTYVYGLTNTDAGGASSGETTISLQALAGHQVQVRRGGQLVTARRYVRRGGVLL